MPLTHVEIRNIRIYKQGQFNPHPRLTLITGDNASGKTTLLEAIHVLSTGKSFRTPRLDTLMRHESDHLSVSGQILDRNSNTVRLGFSLDQAGRHAQLNGTKPQRFADLAQQLPLLVISPDSHFEFQQQSRARRAAIDWVLFHVEHDFQSLWNRYQRALQQRNAALKDPGQFRSRFSWDKELVLLADDIQARRNHRLNELAPRFRDICQRVLATDAHPDIILEPGWEQGQGMEICLASDQSRDQARGFTHSGPHRNDLQITLNQTPSREQASHGQNKLLVIALRLAQIEYLHTSTGQQCCLLIDDLAAELDSEHRQRLATLLADLPVQVIITAIHPEQIDTTGWPESAWFHVEQGTIKPQ